MTKTLTALVPALALAAVVSVARASAKTVIIKKHGHHHGMMHHHGMHHGTKKVIIKHGA